MRHPLGIFFVFKAAQLQFSKKIWPKKLAYFEKNIKIHQFRIFNRAFAVNLFCHKTNL